MTFHLAGRLGRMGETMKHDALVCLPHAHAAILARCDKDTEFASALAGIPLYLATDDDDAQIINLALRITGMNAMILAAPDDRCSLPEMIPDGST